MAKNEHQDSELRTGQHSSKSEVKADIKDSEIKKQNGEKKEEDGSDIKSQKKLKETPKPQKKVTFAEPERTYNSSSDKKPPRPTKADTSKFKFDSGNKLIELNDKDEPVRVIPFQSVDEPPEDAALRREMLEYSLGEVGNIVAQMDMDEEDTSSDVTLGSESEEDQHGRTLGKHIMPEYRTQMLELQERLNGQSQLEDDSQSSAVTTVDDTDNIDTGRNASSASKAQPKIKNLKSGTKQKQGKAKKSLRFADDLQVHHLPKQSPAAHNTRKTVVDDDVISQNKHTGEESTDDVSDKPPAAPLSSVIVEREVKEKPTPEPEELSTEMLIREAQAEYYDIRNRAIQRQGGFLPDEEEEENPLMEEHDGTVRKVSRFMAARLKAAGA